jgi:hypothetical protein
VRGAWRPLPNAGLPPRSARLIRFEACDGRLVALFTMDRKLIAVRLAGRRWRPLGQPVPTGRAIPAVGECDRTAPAPDLALVDVAAGTRALWSLDTGAWRARTPLGDVGGGPTPGGPVRLGSSVYLPVIDASTAPWRLSVYAFEGGNWTLILGPLNRSSGNAQGVVRVNGHSVWAAWQENAPRPDGRFDTRMYVQRVAPVPGAAEKIWSGISIGPGSMETVQGAGSRWVLYMPQARRRAGLTVAVSRLR